MRTTIWCARGRLEQRAVERGFVADVLAQQLAAIDLRQQRAAVERIDDQDVVASLEVDAVPIGVRAAQQEMAREVHARRHAVRPGAPLRGTRPRG